LSHCAIYKPVITGCRDDKSETSLASLATKGLEGPITAFLQNRVTRTFLRGNQTNVGPYYWRLFAGVNVSRLGIELYLELLSPALSLMLPGSACLPVYSVLVYFGMIV